MFFFVYRVKGCLFILDLVADSFIFEVNFLFLLRGKLFAGNLLPDF